MVPDVAPEGTGANAGSRTKAWEHQVCLGMPAFSANDSINTARVPTTFAAKSAPSAPNRGFSRRSVGLNTRNYA